MPNKVSSCCFSGYVEFDRTLRFCHFFLSMLLKNIILFFQISVQLKFNFFVRHFDHFDKLQCLNRQHPLELTKFYLSCFFVELTFCVIHENHRKYEKSWLLLEKLICFDQKAMELVTIRLLNNQSFFKEGLPLTWKLSLNQMSHYEILIIPNALDL